MLPQTYRMRKLGLAFCLIAWVRGCTSRPAGSFGNADAAGIVLFGVDVCFHYSRLVTADLGIVRSLSSLTKQVQTSRICAHPLIVKPAQAADKAIECQRVLSQDEYDRYMKVRARSHTHKASVRAFALLPYMLRRMLPWS